MKSDLNKRTKILASATLRRLAKEISYKSSGGALYKSEGGFFTSFSAYFSSNATSEFRRGQARLSLGLRIKPDAFDSIL